MARHDQFGYDDNRSFARRYGFAIGGGVVALIVVVAVVQLFSGHNEGPVMRHEELTMIRPLPPAPTPPPVTPPPVTPPPQDEPKQQMLDQSPDTAPAKPAEQPAEQPEAMGSNIQGGPADGFGLSGHGNGMAVGGGSGHGGGSKFGWYAAEIVSSVGDALRRNPHTRDATFSIKVRIWSDATGRVTRAKLAGSTGDPQLDNSIQNEVLTGFQLKEPPPDGMPMPIVMRLSARRPN